MSLHDLANQVQSAGRNDDKVLVHMTPGEVSGLQSLAMAHGGSLTINPQTGLPEANFLKSLLPTLIGFGLAPFTGGMSAALITGAGYTAATGSLKKGIMAGLGAYGGAGLGAGLSSLGTTAAAPAVSGLSPTVAANTSALAGTSPLANIGNTAVSSVDDIFLQAAKANPPVSATTGMIPTPGMTSTTLNQSLLNPQVNFATGMKLPTMQGTPGTYFPNKAGVNLSGVTEPPYVTQVGEPYRSITLKPDPVLEAYGPLNPAPAPVMPRGATGYSFDPLTNKYTYYGPGATPINATASSKIVPSTYVPNTATTTQQFAGKLPSAAQPSNAVDLSGQAISRPFSDYMSQVGRGAKTALSGTDGLKALYSAAEVAAPYSGVASLGSTAMSYYDDKREKAEEAMRRSRDKSTGMIRPYDFTYGSTGADQQPYTGSAERTYFNPVFTARTPYESPGPEYAAAGGLMGYAVGGPVEDMAAMNAVGANTGYPMANLQTPMYSNPAMQRPEATNVIAPSADAGVSAYSGEARFSNGGPAFMGPIGSGYVGAGNYIEKARLPESTAPRPSGATPTTAASLPKYTYDPSTMQFSQTVGGSNMSGGIATPAMQPAAPARPLVPNIDIPVYQTPEQQLGLGGFYDYMNSQLGGYGGYGGYAAGGNVGGVSHLGDYSDGGRLLKGPGDGVSDSIPASIGNRQPARLADGEFVVPARIVSEIGNGSTEAGARKLYAMMDRVQKARRKTVGKGQVARNTKAEKLLPA